jgi:hypothetical protein
VFSALVLATIKAFVSVRVGTLSAIPSRSARRPSNVGNLP